CTSDHPAIFARAVPQPILDVIGSARSQAVAPQFPGPLLVVGVKHSVPGLTVGRTFGHACVFVPTVVVIIMITVGQRRPDHLVDGVHDGLVTLLALAKSSNGLDRVRYIGRLHEDAVPLARAVCYRLIDEVEMPLLANAISLEDDRNRSPGVRHSALV